MTATSDSLILLFTDSRCCEPLWRCENWLGCVPLVLARFQKALMKLPRTPAPSVKGSRYLSPELEVAKSVLFADMLIQEEGFFQLRCSGVATGRGVGLLRMGWVRLERKSSTR